MNSSDYKTGLMIQCCGTDGSDVYSSLRPELLVMNLDQFIVRKCGMAIASVTGRGSPSVLGAWIPGGKFRAAAEFAVPDADRGSWSDALTVSDWALDYWRDFGRICDSHGLKAGFYLPTLWVADLSISYRMNRERLERLMKLIGYLGARPWVVFDALHGARPNAPHLAAQPRGSFGASVVSMLIDMGCFVDGEPQPRAETFDDRIGTFETIQVRNAAAKVKGADAYDAPAEVAKVAPRRWLWCNDVPSELAGRAMSRAEAVIAAADEARADGFTPLHEATLDFWASPEFRAAV